MKRVAFGIFLFALVIGSVFAQSELQPLVRVKLNSSKPETIMLKELKNRVDVYQKQTGAASFTVEQKKEILDALIDEKLVVQAAQKEGMNITGTQTDQIFQQSISQMVGHSVTEAEFAELVKKNYKMTVDQLLKEQVGMSLSEYKTYLKNQVLARNYVLSKKQDEIKQVAPTDAEIRSFYELNKTSFVQSDMLKLFVVVVPKEKDSKAAKAKLTKLYDDFKAKKITTDQMKNESKKENPEYKAGDLLVGKNEQYTRQLGMSYQALLELFNQDKGFFSDVSENETDWYFFQIANKYGAKMLSISDSVQPESTTTVYDYIKTTLTNQKQQQYFMKAVQDITNELNTPANVERIKTGKELDNLLDW